MKVIPIALSIICILYARVAGAEVIALPLPDNGIRIVSGTEILDCWKFNDSLVCCNRGSVLKPPLISPPSPPKCSIGASAVEIGLIGGITIDTAIWELGAQWPLDEAREDALDFGTYDPELCAQLSAECGQSWMPVYSPACWEYWNNCQ